MSMEGIIGMEWRIAKPLSITVEYRNGIYLSYYKNDSETTNYSGDVVTSITHDNSIAPSSYLSSEAVIGLSFFF